MFHAELRYLESPDVPKMDLESWIPDDPENVGLLVDAEVSTPGDKGVDYFTFLVRTPRYLADDVQRNPNGFRAGARHGLAQWVPVWRFPNAAMQHDAETELDRLLSVAGPPTFVVAARDLVHDVLRVHAVSSGELEHVTNWFDHLGLVA